MFVCSCERSKPCTMMNRKSIAKCDHFQDKSQDTILSLCWEYRRQIVPLEKECIDSFGVSSEVCLRIRFAKKFYSGSESAFAASNVS